MQLVEILQSNLNEFDIISFFFIKPNCVCIIKVNFQGSFYCIIEFLCNLNIQSPCTHNQCDCICVSFTHTGFFYLATMSKESYTKWQQHSHLARSLNIPLRIGERRGWGVAECGAQTDVRWLLGG